MFPQSNFVEIFILAEQNHVFKKFCNEIYPPNLSTLTVYSILETKWSSFFEFPSRPPSRTFVSTKTEKVYFIKDNTFFELADICCIFLAAKRY